MKRTDKKLLLFGLLFFISIIASISSEGHYILYATMAIIVVYVLTPKIRTGVDKVSFEPLQNISRHQKLRVFIISALTALAVMVFWFIGTCPGFFSPDSTVQYEQAVTGQYDDWFPVWHTFLFFTLPLKLTGWPGSIVLFQILWFVLLIGYYAQTVYTYGGSLYTKIALVFIICTPFTLEIMMYPWKDTVFGIAAGFCMLFAVHIYMSKGQWCNRFPNILLMAFMLVNATIFRHNGILFTFFLIIVLPFFMSKWRWVELVSISAVLFILIKIPLYSWLGVQKPGDRLLEISGLPLCVITSTAKECPQKLDTQTLQFVDDLLSVQPDWKENHSYDGFNSIKFKGMNNSVIDNAGVTGIIRMTWDCLKSAPLVSLKALRGVTLPVYDLGYGCIIHPDIADNDFGWEYSGSKIVRSIQKCYLQAVYKTPLRIVLSNIAITILVMLAFILFKSNLRDVTDWKRIMLCVPVLFYDFGTMLFMAEHDIRFFYMNWIIVPLIVLIMGSKKICN